MHGIKTVGVIGCGQMGGGIAQVSAVAGFKTLVYDAFPKSLDKCKADHEKRRAMWKSRNSRSPKRMQRESARQRPGTRSAIATS